MLCAAAGDEARSGQPSPDRGPPRELFTLSGFNRLSSKRFELLGQSNIVLYGRRLPGHPLARRRRHRGVRVCARGTRAAGRFLILLLLDAVRRGITAAAR